MEHQPNEMMGNNLPAGDPDFDLLESYLDGELTADKIGRLQQRLAAEPELAEALSRMSVEYAVRRAVFATMEPSDADAAQMSAQLTRSARRVEMHRRLVKFWRAAAAAACLSGISFAAGWVGRGNTVAAAAPSVNLHAPRTQPASPPHIYAYQVALTDEAGNITAVQQFDTLEAARNFAADVGRWQASQPPPAPEPRPARSSGL